MKNRQSIISLLPAATEMVYRLGLEKELVGVSHDCDWPFEVKSKPILSSSVVSNAMSSLAIDMLVKKSEHRGTSVFHIDKETLQALSPTLVLTQELCPVCAISFDEVQNACRILETEAKIISLEPESIADIFQNIHTVATATKKEKTASRVVSSLQKRLDVVKSKLKMTKLQPTVLVIEWLDPLMVAGHWVPEMVGYAGGSAVLTKPKGRSRLITVDDMLRSDLDTIIIAPCGFAISRTLEEEDLIGAILENHNLKAVKNKQVYLVDGNAYLTRPGPRIIDGVEILAEILHPTLFLRKHTKCDWETYTF